MPIRSPDLKEYRAKKLVVRDRSTNEFSSVSPRDYGAIEAVPEFAARWAASAAKIYGNDKVLTGTVNASGACPIGGHSLCGQYCFAHRSWSETLSPREDVVQKYLRDADKLRSHDQDVGIFMSYDTEPFPGGIVSEISAKLLKAMTDKPPGALLIHSHTAHIGDEEVVPVIRDVAQATDVIVGIGFETDSDDVGDNRPHHHPVGKRLDAFERLAAAGIKTQASTTPLLGFRDYRGFIQRFHDVGTHRIMIGELRKEFEGGGDRRARGLDIGLDPLSEEEARTVCQEFAFPGGVEIREVFYVTMT